MNESLLLAALVPGLAVLFAGMVFVHVRHIVRQQRAERRLVALLAGDAGFRSTLADYAEEVYREGRARPEARGELARTVSERVRQLGADGWLVREALEQPSLVGRQRYLDKITLQTLTELVDVPVRELELAMR